MKKRRLLIQNQVLRQRQGRGWFSSLFFLGGFSSAEDDAIFADEDLDVPQHLLLDSAGA